MSSTNQSSSFHKQAATDHQAATLYHLQAAESHDNNKHNEAKIAAANALDSSKTAHSRTEAAFNNSVINSNADINGIQV